MQQITLEALRQLGFDLRDREIAHVKTADHRQSNESAHVDQDRLIVDLLGVENADHNLVAGAEQVVGGRLGLLHLGLLRRGGSWGRR